MHGLGRTDVRALVAIMDAARAGRPMTAGALGAAGELSPAAGPALSDRPEPGGQRGGGELSSASVPALIARLERVGHVERVRDEHDRRRVVLQMTPAAMAAGGEFFGGLQRDLVAAMGGYSDEGLAAARRFLADMTDVIVRHQASGDPQR